MEVARSFQLMIAFVINDWLNERVLIEIYLTVWELLRQEDILLGGASREALMLGQ